MRRRARSDAPYRQPRTGQWRDFSAVGADDEVQGQRGSAEFQLTGDVEVWAKLMEDGSRAVGLFNRGEVPAAISAQWSDLWLTGSHRVRDLWRQQDLGEFQREFQATVPRHGVVLVRVN